MDAPTQDQFDLPVQPRSYRDSVKSVEGMKKWASKIHGVMASGIGMVIYVARVGVAEVLGPNLTLTVLYLTLLRLAASPRGLGNALGTRFSLLADGTAAYNNNKYMVMFLCWLVYCFGYDRVSSRLLAVCFRLLLRYLVVALTG